MNVKRELSNALQLFLLLLLFFWSCTWNSNVSFDTLSSTKHKRSIKDSKYSNADSCKSVNQHTVLVESFSTVRHAFIQSSTTHLQSGIIPPFNEWKEKEKTKHDEGSLSEVAAGRHRKTSGRKLNYSSSKCGAKVLASNPEAKHRIAILSDKSDEYMLNPCRAKTWFVLELCDTVEATQVQLANYELYSSSPKHFSVFWSDVYPTLVWHHLGTFEAKDQRTMQTFDLGVKNLGKFIKIIIFSHHGKEHYCPLSVVRILGFSMVDEFQELELRKRHLSEERVKFNEFSKSKSSDFQKNSSKSEMIKTSTTYSNISSKKMLSLPLLYCMEMSNKANYMKCANQPSCRFFRLILNEFSGLYNINTCPSIQEKSRKMPHSGEEARKGTTNLFHKHKHLKNRNHINDSSKYSISEKAAKSPHKKFRGFINGNTTESYQRLRSHLMPLKENLNKSSKYTKLDKIRINFDQTVIDEHSLKKSHYTQKYCDCKDIRMTLLAPSSEESKKRSNEANNQQVFLEHSHETDSARLIQKESVFLKLTSRIKSLEVDLSFINKYLQQLSQSYRNQMENTQTLFNLTVKAISGAAEEASVVDAQQQEAITALGRKVNSLNVKVQYLMNSQKDLLKRVVELHGFFIILELIIISTIFTIFLNIFNRKTASFLAQKQKFMPRKHLYL